MTRVRMMNLGLVLAALAVPACGGASSSAAPGSTTESSADQALRDVQTCEDGARCGQDAGAGDCDDDALRSCLMGVLPDGGSPPVAKGSDDDEREADGADPSDHDQSKDGGAAAHDGGRSQDDSDGQGRPAPAGAQSVGVHACIDALHACLAGSTPASTCASTAQTCLKALHDGGKDS